MARTIPVNTLVPPKAPNLLTPPLVYAPLYHDQVNNVLRIYFNQLDNALSTLLGGTGGAFLRLPYGSFYQNGNTTLTANMTNVSTTAIQVTSTDGFENAGYLLIQNELVQHTGRTATTFTGITRGVLGTTNVAHTAGVAVTEAAGVAAGSSAAIKIDATTSSNGVTVTEPDSKIYFTYPGVYNIQFSAQLLNYTTTDDNVTFWIKQNGTDVSYTAGLATVASKHGTTAGAGIVGWNWVLEIQANDYIEIYWANDSGNTALATYPAGTAPVHPVSPSVIVTATFVSGLTT